jgi:uncharacterized protein
MFIRPKDFISIDDRLFFAVVSEYQEEDRALTYLRYIKDGNEMQKLDTQQANKLISESYPELLFHSHYADIELHGISLASIKQIYRPDQTVVRLMDMESPDAKQQDAIKIIKLLLEAGIQLDYIGVTGSLMLDTHNEQSDIDMIIYGRERFFKVRQAIQKYLKSGELESLNEFMWQDAWQRRDCTLSFDEYQSHELRKFNKCISGTSKVDISMIPETYERFQENGPYKKMGQDKILAVVTEDTYAYDFPARYFIDHETINELVSYTATYTGQAQQGEKIEAAGYVEQGSDGKKRLLVGTSREAVGEYIRVVK